MWRTTDRRQSASKCGWLCLALLALPACRPDDNSIQLLEIQVIDLERAVSFYQAVFDWGASRPDSSYAVLDAPPVAIGLALRDSVRSAGPGIVILTQDLDMIFARVVQHGGVVRAPIGPSWQGRQFTFTDLDGNQMIVRSESPDTSGG